MDGDGQIRIVCIDEWPYRFKPWMYLEEKKPKYVAPQVDQNGVASWLVPRAEGEQMLKANRNRFRLYQTAPFTMVDEDGIQQVNPWYYRRYSSDKPLEWHENKDGLPLDHGDGTFYGTGGPAAPVAVAPAAVPLSPREKLHTALVSHPKKENVPICVQHIDEACGEGKGKALLEAYSESIGSPPSAFTKAEFADFAQLVIAILEGEKTYDATLAELISPPAEAEI